VLWALKSAACSGARESQCGLSSERRRTRPSGASLSRSAWSSRVGDLTEPGFTRARLPRRRDALSTASSTLSRQEGDSIESVDLRGHLHLVQAARKRACDTWSSSRSPSSCSDFRCRPRSAPSRTRSSRAASRTPSFNQSYSGQTWLSPALGFNPVAGNARVLGDGNAKVSWLAAATWRASRRQPVDNPKGPPKDPGARRARSAVGARRPADLSRGRWARDKGRSSFRSTTSETQMNAAVDPLRESFSALMLMGGRAGQVVDQAALDHHPLDLTTVRRFAERELASLLN